MINTVRASGNPQAMMQQMLGSNPMMAQAMKLVQENGGDAKKAFYSLADQQGVNGDQIIGMLR